MNNSLIHTYIEKPNKSSEVVSYTRKGYITKYRKFVVICSPRRQA